MSFKTAHYPVKRLLAHITPAWYHVPHETSYIYPMQFGNGLGGTADGCSAE